MSKLYVITLVILAIMTYALSASADDKSLFGPAWKAHITQESERDFLGVPCSDPSLSSTYEDFRCSTQIEKVKDRPSFGIRVGVKKPKVASIECTKVITDHSTPVNLLAELGLLKNADGSACIAKKIQFESGNYELTPARIENISDVTIEGTPSTKLIVKPFADYAGGTTCALVSETGETQHMSLCLSDSQRVKFKNLTFSLNFQGKYEVGILGKIQEKVVGSRSIRIVKTDYAWNTDIYPAENFPPESEIYTIASFKHGNFSRNCSTHSWIPDSRTTKRAILCRDAKVGAACTQSNLWGTELRKVGENEFTSPSLSSFPMGAEVVLLPRRAAYPSVLGVYGKLSEDITLDSLRITGSLNMGIYAKGGKGLLIKNTKILDNTEHSVRPGTACISNRADGIHVVGMKGNLLLLNNKIKMIGDDGFNIRGIDLEVVGANASTSTLDVTYASRETLLTTTGDHLALFSRKKARLKDLGFLGVLKINSEMGTTMGTDPITQRPKIIGAHFNVSKPNSLWPELPHYSVAATLRKVSLIDRTQYEIVAMNLNKATSGYWLEENTVNDNLGRGIVLRAPNGVVTNNRFAKSNMPGAFIGVSNGFFFEGPGPVNLAFIGNLLHNNMNMRTLNTLQGGIEISVENHTEAHVGFPLMQDIKIHSNNIKHVKGPGIRNVGISKDVSISDNLFENTRYSCSDIAFFTSHSQMSIPDGTMQFLGFARKAEDSTAPVGVRLSGNTCPSHTCQEASYKPGSKRTVFARYPNRHNWCE